MEKEKKRDKEKKKKQHCFILQPQKKFHKQGQENLSLNTNEQNLSVLA